MRIKPVAAFFTTLVIEAGLAWIAGYNFDERGVVVAYCALVAVVIAFGAAQYVEGQTP